MSHSCFRLHQILTISWWRVHCQFQLFTELTTLDKWLSWLGGLSLLMFKFKVQHIKGTDNVVADSLSRIFEPADLTEISSENVGKQSPSPPTTASFLFSLPAAFQDIRAHQIQDPEISQILKLKTLPPNFKLTEKL